MSFLVFTDDNGKSVEVRLDEKAEVGRDGRTSEVCVITRNSVRHLGITDGTLSRKHACISIESGRVLLQDMGSMNGTRINGNPLLGWQSQRSSEVVEIKVDSEIIFGYNTIARIVLCEPTRTTDEIRRLGLDVASPVDKSPGLNVPHSAPDAGKDHPDFIRIITEISCDCCSIDVTTRDLTKKFDVLKKHLSEGELLNAAVAIERKINAELAPEEYLDDEHVVGLRVFCKEFTDTWLSKSQR